VRDECCQPRLSKLHIQEEIAPGLDLAVSVRYRMSNWTIERRNPSVKSTRSSSLQAQKSAGERAACEKGIELVFVADPEILTQFLKRLSARNRTQTVKEARCLGLLSNK
jgi:hypothetical protein